MHLQIQILSILFKIIVIKDIFNVNNAKLGATCLVQRYLKLKYTKLMILFVLNAPNSEEIYLVIYSLILTRKLHSILYIFIKNIKCKFIR